MMNDSRKKLLDSCIRQLEMLKCEFAIIDEDGEVHGTLELAGSRKKHRDYRQYGYREICDAMLVGDTYTFADCVGADRVTVNNYRSAIGSRLLRTYGAGSATLQVMPDGSVVARRIA